MAKVSVIIPVYNVEQYLRQCLECLINQTLQDIEFICVDDCSTDNSLQILEEYAKNDNRFILLKTDKNSGIGIARNKGIKFAKGEYIGFVDPDDWLEKTMFEKLYNNAKENDSDVAMCNYRRFFEDENEFKNPYFIRTVNNNYNFVRIKDVQPKHVTKKYFKKNLFVMPMCSWNKIYRNKLIKENNIKFQENRYMEDVEFGLYIFFRAETVSYLDEILYYYRIRNTSTMWTNKNRTDEAFEVFDNAYRILTEEKQYKNLIFNFKFFIIFTLMRVAKKLNYFQKIRLYIKAKKYLDRNELGILKERIEI